MSLSSSHVSPSTNKITLLTYKPCNEDLRLNAFTQRQLIHYGEESHKGGPLKIKLINEEQTDLKNGKNNCTHPLNSLHWHYVFRSNFKILRITHTHTHLSGGLFTTNGFDESLLTFCLQTGSKGF